jgi:aminopeptidase YwaD
VEKDARVKKDISESLGRSIENIREHYDMLCKKIGSRHLGSKGEMMAAEYLAACLKSYGYNVVEERFETPGWDCESYCFQYAETGLDVPGCPCFYSNSCNLEQELISIDKDTLQIIEGIDLDKSLCFIDVRPDVLAKYGRNELAEALDKKGVAAAVFISDHNDTYDTKFVRSPFLKQMAVVCVSGNTAYEISENVGKRFRLRIAARNFTCQSPNVVARVLNGPGKFVIGAHYDTAPGIEGATDNASGTASLLEIARLLSGRVKNYSVDFVAFSGEEYARIGSLAYLKQHSSEIADMKCMLNLDADGTALGKLKICVQLSDGISGVVREILSGHKLKIDPEYPKTSDEAGFFDNGVPIVLFSNDNNKYAQMHTPKDSLDRISYGKTALAARIASDIIMAIDNNREGLS